MKEAEKERMNLKRIIKKYELEKEEGHDIWIDPPRIMALMTIEEGEQWLLKCYPYNINSLSYSEMLLEKDDIYYKLGDSWYWDEYIECSRKILGKQVQFIYSDKINPLVCKGEKYMIAIAPRFSERVYKLFLDFDNPEVFKDLTGCKCPKIIERRKNEP